MYQLVRSEFGVDAAVVSNKQVSSLRGIIKLISHESYTYYFR